MLWTLFVILLIAWLVGLIGFHVVAWYIHILLVIAIVAIRATSTLLPSSFPARTTACKPTASGSANASSPRLTSLETG